jgi:LPXTG-motif cell wall-anchored protein
MDRFSLRFALALGLALWVAIVGAAAVGLAASDTVQVKQDPKLGKILADGRGMTLYTFKKDQPGTSNCSDACATAWPPLTLAQGDPVAPAGLGGSLSLVTRKDGSKQVAYNGMPLYLYAKDGDSEDAYGQGVGGVWYVVNATAQPAAMPNTGSAGDTAPLAGGLAALGAVALGLGVGLRRRGLVR